MGWLQRFAKFQQAVWGRRDGNMDVKEITCGTILYLPVFAEGTFRRWRFDAVQADGEVSFQR
ncbi:acetamidase/formamidase family protein [Candidatus Bathyarchaeota archaeon]|nr:acetamidase/formamidase family protein [Candidatus Bathyarchaeota archaeon]